MGVRFELDARDGRKKEEQKGGRRDDEADAKKTELHSLPTTRPKPTTAHERDLWRVGKLKRSDRRCGATFEI